MAITAPRGTRDILPGESARWIRLEDIMREVCALFGYEEIRTPIFEKTELFVRGVGDGTDIVQKEMYTFVHRDKESFALKPEGTAGVVRAFTENKLYAAPQPTKLYYITPCFRAERPQKGRYRQFHQFGIEVLGSKSAAVDAEVMAVAVNIFERTGAQNIELNINSVGCPKCRGAYHEKLKAYLKEKLDILCEDCLNRYEKNPMRVLDCKEDGDKLTDAPFMIDYLCEECGDHFDELKRHLAAMDIAYIVNPRIVRGLDYYEKTAFEFVSKEIGAQGTVCGGGRYDGLSDLIGDIASPGIGFGLGLERLLLLTEATLTAPQRTFDVYVACIGRKAGEAASRIVKHLRDNDVSAERDYMERSLKAQMKYADKLGVRYVLLLGEAELESGRAIFKEMQSGRQVELPVAGIEEALIKALNEEETK